MTAGRICERRQPCLSDAPFARQQRLAELRSAGIAERGHSGYRLTGEGRAPLAIDPPVPAWAERWARREREAAGT
jgi:hypothetical protein